MMPSLYVHVPFCIKKCNYCAFYSVPLPLQQGEKPCSISVEPSIQPSSRAMVKRYLESIQYQSTQPENTKVKVSSLFIGGGTPTALDEEELNFLLTTLHEGFEIAAYVEQTIEGNPGTLTPQKLSILKKQGINRISLGAQSFDDQLLRQIGRIHSAEDIREGVRLIRQAGFKNLNLDLMFGLPGQTLADWQRTLEEAMRLQPEHLSIYSLMIEEGTPLALQRERLIQLPDDDQQAEMYGYTREALRNAGYRHYETSNFALPGYECQHNLGYWRGLEYFGLGPGAVSFLDNRRWKNIEDLNRYAEKLSLCEKPNDPEEDEVIGQREQMAERIVLALRLADGLNLRQFEEEFSQKLTDIFPAILERYLNQGVLIIENGSLKIKENYWFVANSVLQDFM